MKKLITLCLISLLLFSECSKEEYTGRLQLKFKVAPGNNFSDIAISVFSFEDLNHLLFQGYPDINGNYSKELLPGSYEVRIFYRENIIFNTFQIINGETTKFNYNYSKK